MVHADLQELYVKGSYWKHKQGLFFWVFLFHSYPNTKLLKVFLQRASSNNLYIFLEKKVSVHGEWDALATRNLLFLNNYPEAV